MWFDPLSSTCNREPCGCLLIFPTRNENYFSPRPPSTLLAPPPRSRPSPKSRLGRESRHPGPREYHAGAINRGTPTAWAVRVAVLQPRPRSPDATSHNRRQPQSRGGCLIQPPERAFAAPSFPRAPPPSPTRYPNVHNAQIKGTNHTAELHALTPSTLERTTSFAARAKVLLSFLVFRFFPAALNHRLRAAHSAAPINNLHHVD